jgi:hypothetical protein
LIRNWPTQRAAISLDEDSNYISSYAWEEVLLELEDDEALVELGRGQHKK